VKKEKEGGKTVQTSVDLVRREGGLRGGGGRGAGSGKHASNQSSYYLTSYSEAEEEGMGRVGTPPCLCPRTGGGGGKKTFPKERAHAVSCPPQLFHREEKKRGARRQPVVTSFEARSLGGGEGRKESWKKEREKCACRWRRSQCKQIGKKKGSVK